MIYFDSCILIGLMESPSLGVPGITDELKLQHEHSVAVSELVRLECLVGCRRSGNAEMEQDYEAYFADQTVHFLTIDRLVWNRAIALLGQHVALRVPDALHLATAIEHHCSVFWSFDQHLLSIAENYISVFPKP